MKNPYAKQTFMAKSREEVTLEYAPLVKRIATRLAARLPDSLDVQDLIQAGMIGLLDAMDKYETGHDAQFKTYAEFRIRGAMLDELRSCDWVPRSVRDTADKLSRAHRDLMNKLGRMPDETEIAKALDMSLPEYQETLLKSKAIPMLNIEDVRPHGHDEEMGSLLEILADPGCKNPLEELAVNDVLAKVSQAIEKLPEKEKLVLSLYYDEDLNLKEIGEVLSITESRVSQLRTQAIVRIRSQLSDTISTELLNQILEKRDS